MASERGTRRASLASPSPIPTPNPISIGFCYLEPVQRGLLVPASIASHGRCQGRGQEPGAAARPWPCVGTPGPPRWAQRPRPRSRSAVGGSRGGQRAASPQLGLRSEWLCLICLLGRHVSPSVFPLFGFETLAGISSAVLNSGGES